MIEQDCFGKTWIDSKREELRVADPGLLEKCIHALQLLGYLQEIGDFDFVFKGGTSMVLLLPAPRRLSIDIDIACKADPSEYKPIIETIGNTPPFITVAMSDVLNGGTSNSSSIPSTPSVKTTSCSTFLRKRTISRKRIFCLFARHSSK